MPNLMAIDRIVTLYEYFIPPVLAYSCFLLLSAIMIHDSQSTIYKNNVRTISSVFVGEETPVQLYDHPRALEK